MTDLEAAEEILKGRFEVGNGEGQPLIHSSGIVCLFQVNSF